MAPRTAQWFLSLQMILYLFLIFVRGNEDVDDAYKNGRSLVLEYFLPINLPAAADVPLGREKRDAEGSGEDDSVFNELGDKSVEEAENSTQSVFATFTLHKDSEKSVNALLSTEGSGEIDEVNKYSDVSSEKQKDDTTLATLIAKVEDSTKILTDEMIKTTKNLFEVITENSLSNTEMIFDKSEDLDAVSTIRAEETTSLATEPSTVILRNIEIDKKEELEGSTMGSISEEYTTEGKESRRNESTTLIFQEPTIFDPMAARAIENITTTLPAEAATLIPEEDEIQTANFLMSEATPPAPQTTAAFVKETTTTSSAESTIPILILQTSTSSEGSKSVVDDTTPHSTEETTKTPDAVRCTSKFLTSLIIPDVTEIPAKPPAVPDVIDEEIFKETKSDKKLEALPGNILQKENLSLAADPFLIANTRLMDSEENVQLSSSEPKRLGAYIVIGLILLSFSSLVGYITFKKRMNRKRQEFESNQESNDTEKALLSLSDYKDNSELEENHLKNNEITPIVVKSNSQINKFEKNTNFSSTKNLNTIANEKNIEKDNVLKSTAENLTQVIIEDSPKDVEEDKNVPSMEKLIVKTRIDQDSIPKKPIIINRSSTGYLPIPQDNS